MLIYQSDIAQSVNGITGRHLFCTCWNAVMAIQCLELLYVASFAWILDKNVLFSMPSLQIKATLF